MPDEHEKRWEERLTSELAASLRTKAELARRLANAISNPKAGRELRDMADELDEEADKLEKALKRS